MNDYKLLYRSYGLLDAKSIQILLESFNIKSKAYQESAGVALGLTIGGLGSANIYVKNEDYESAMKVITMMENGQLEMPQEAGGKDGPGDKGHRQQDRFHPARFGRVGEGDKGGKRRGRERRGARERGDQYNLL